MDESGWTSCHGVKPACKNLNFVKSGKIGSSIFGSYWQFRLSRLLIRLLISMKEI